MAWAGLISQKNKAKTSPQAPPIQNKLQSKFIRFNPFNGEEPIYANKTTSFISIDFETANELPVSICEVGYTIVSNGKIVESSSQKIKPPEVRFTNTHIHGISAADIQACPTFDLFWNTTFKKLITNNVVIAHNAEFDVGCMEASFKHYGIEPPRYKVIDTLRVSRQEYKNLPNHKLPTVASFLGINLQHHNAQSDSIACATILLLAQENNNHSPQTIYMHTADPKSEVQAFLEIIKNATNTPEIAAMSLLISDIENDPWVKDNDKALHHRVLGEAYERCNLLKEAVSEYELALKFNPKVGVKQRLSKLNTISQ